MAIYLRFLTAALLLAAAASAAAGAASGGESADAPLRISVHDILAQFGLPKGLVPSSVTSYSVAPTGEFEVELASACYLHFTDLVYYERVIKGTLSFGTISNLSGIQVKKLFVWVPLTGITADKDTIVFQVGFFSEALPTSLFEAIRVCNRGAAGILPEAIPISEI